MQTNNAVLFPSAHSPAESTPLLKKSTGRADTNKESQLKKACQDFEAIILQQMLSAMRKSVPKSGLLDSGFTQEMYQGMYDESLAQDLARSGGMGLADALFRQLTPSATVAKNKV